MELPRIRVFRKWYSSLHTHRSGEVQVQGHIESRLPFGYALISRVASALLVPLREGLPTLQNSSVAISFQAASVLFASVTGEILRLPWVLEGGTYRLEGGWETGDKGEDFALIRSL